MSNTALREGAPKTRQDLQRYLRREQIVNRAVEKLYLLEGGRALEKLLALCDDTLAGALEALGGMLASAHLHPPPPSPWTVALDLAEILVRRGLPFRQAHHAVGRLVGRLQAEGRTPADLGADELAAAHPLFQAADAASLSPAASVAARRVPGGAGMDSVRDQIARLRTILAE